VDCGRGGGDGGGSLVRERERVKRQSWRSSLERAFSVSQPRHL